MKITELWKSESRPTLSFEVFPARTPKAAEGLPQVLDTLTGLKPDFMSVTFGAGGSTREGSAQLIKTLQETGQAVLAYFAGYGLGPLEMTEILDGYRDMGVENLLAVRGDAPREEGFVPHPASFSFASDLVGFLRPKYAFCLGVAGYPEGHLEAPSLEKDLEHLKRKVDLGAEFIISNYFYDNRYFFDFRDRCQAAGIRIPVLPGIMPIYSVKMMGTRLSRNPRASRRRSAACQARKRSHRDAGHRGRPLTQHGAQLTTPLWPGAAGIACPCRVPSTWNHHVSRHSPWHARPALPARHARVSGQPGTLAKTCGATITDDIRRVLFRLDENDKAGLLAFGIEHATRQALELLKADVPGLHLYTMDRSESAVGIVNALRRDGLLRRDDA